MAIENIRIDDLAQPVLTAWQAKAIRAAERFPVVFEEEHVLAAARGQTGLDDFGSLDFLPRLRIWLEAAREDENASAPGRIGLYSDILRYAVARLRVEDFCKRCPEALEEEIEQPIIILGLPRSGTTHLLNLIAADSRLRSLPYWESREPIPVRGEGPGADGLDPRYKRCRAVFERTDDILPHTKAMHHMTPEHVHEEIELQAIDFSSYVIEWIADVPRWRDAYLALDQTSSYAYMRKVLRILQFLRGPKRWVLKSPQHLEQIGPLLSNFPDATFAVTARDPVSVIASTITMQAYAARLRCTRVDLAAIATYWIDRVEVLLRRCVEDRGLLPADRSIDVPFHEFMADDLRMVERIQGLAGFEATPAARAELAAYMAANPRGKHGRLVYDLSGDFGIEPAALRERFRFYFERFGVEVEG